MKKEEMVRLLEEKEKLKEKTEMIFHQLVGQIAMLRDMIKAEDAQIPPTDKSV